MVNEELNEFDNDEELKDYEETKNVVKLDFVTMIFFLSAIHPKEHSKVIKKIAERMKVGGCLLFRDYGLFDLAMMRFIKKKKGIIDID